ncbi:MAG TPA: hypothetical protein VFQ88_00500 [Nevskiaceae bacterium]|nr:hypothetical protein [Nevskiaceae bacterium]
MSGPAAKVTIRSLRNLLLPVVVAVACSACVAYPIYGSGYGYSSYGGYGDSGYSYAPAWGSGLTATYWSGSSYLYTPRLYGHDNRNHRSWNGRRTWSGNAHHGAWTAHRGSNARGMWHGGAHRSGGWHH